MTTKQEQKIEVKYFELCAECGHTQDWHHIGDLLWKQMFGVKFGECTHYTKDATLPFWKRKKIPCGCKGFKKLNKGVIWKNIDVLSVKDETEELESGFIHTKK